MQNKFLFIKDYYEELNHLIQKNKYAKNLTHIQTKKLFYKYFSKISHNIHPFVYKKKNVIYTDEALLKLKILEEMIL